jgi:hypothetical protein
VNVVLAFFFFDLSLMIPESDAPLFSQLADPLESPDDDESPILLPLHALELIIFFSVLFGVFVAISNVDFGQMLSLDEFIDESFLRLTPLLMFKSFRFLDSLLLLSLDKSI